MLMQTHVPIAVCLFVDGLDEFDGNYESVVRRLNDLAGLRNIKICLSSRPLPVFEEAFSKAPSLILQDFTYESIRAYVDLQLSEPIKIRNIHHEHGQDRVHKLVNKIVGRADGVFLWAVIATRDIREGLQGFADLGELFQAINSLPTQLEDLFMLMLHRIRPAYQRDAARFLQFVLYAPYGEPDSDYSRPIPLRLCSLYLIHGQRDFEDAAFSYERVPPRNIVEGCSTLRTQLISHTAGLLDLVPHSTSYPRDDLSGTQNEPILQTRIFFLHRTARDFLSHNDKATSFLARNGLMEAQVHLALANGRLAEIAQFEYGRKSYPAFVHLQTALRHIALAERSLGVPQSQLMQSLAFESYVQKYSSADMRGQAGSTLFSGYPLPFVFGLTKEWCVVEMVGMAASVGMTGYVCEQLGISTEQHYASSVLNLSEPVKSNGNSGTLTWHAPSTLENCDGSPTLGAFSLNYRQTLAKYLRLDPLVDDSSTDDNSPLENSAPDSQEQSGRTPSSGTRSSGEGDVVEDVGLQNNTEWVKRAFAETYLLACCPPTCYDLIRVLLSAGANPMICVGHGEFMPRELGVHGDLIYGYRGIG